MINESVPREESENRLATDLRKRVGQCVEEDAAGQQRLTVTLPDRAALDNLADSLARLLSVQESKQD